MSVCVIGASGFLGRAVCRELDCRRIVVQQCSSRSDIPVFSGVGLLVDDFRLPVDCDCVVYLAQSPYYRQLPEMIQHVWNVNVVSAMELARRARETGVRHFIYASTGTVYEPSYEPLGESAPVQRRNLYALSKLHAEEGLHALAGEMTVTRLRIFGIYGPGQEDKLIPSLINKIASRNPIYLETSPFDDSYPEGLQLSLCHVDDAAKIIAELTNLGIDDVLNLASDEVVSIKYIAEQIADVLQVEAKYEIKNGTRTGNLVADIGKLTDHLNPSFIPLAKGVESTVAAHVKRQSPGRNNDSA